MGDEGVVTAGAIIRLEQTWPIPMKITDDGINMICNWKNAPQPNAFSVIVFFLLHVVAARSEGRKKSEHTLTRIHRSNGHKILRMMGENV